MHFDNIPFMAIQWKTTSSQCIASRARDPKFEKLIDNYKNLFKVVAIQDLILANSNGAASFLSKYPHIFHIFYKPSKSQPFCKLTDAVQASMPIVVDRLVLLLSMSISISKTLPLRTIFKVWRKLGLPDAFEDSIILQNPHLFKICNAHEPSTHILKLVSPISVYKFSAAVDNWRITEFCREDSRTDGTEMRFSFKHGFPPGMRLSRSFKTKVKKWQRLLYIEPYEEMGEMEKSNAGMMRLEKRAVGIIHEFLSLTVEKTVEVEKISHFRNWFGIHLNIRDLFFNHPGIFYLSTKGKRHTVFLREANERGCLIDPNSVYDVRRKLLDLVILGHLISIDLKSWDTGKSKEIVLEKEEND